MKRYMNCIFRKEQARDWNWALIRSDPFHDVGNQTVSKPELDDTPTRFYAKLWKR